MLYVVQRAGVHLSVLYEAYSQPPTVVVVRPCIAKPSLATRHGQAMASGKTEALRVRSGSVPSRRYERATRKLTCIHIDRCLGAIPLQAASDTIISLEDIQFLVLYFVHLYHAFFAQWSQKAPVMQLLICRQISGRQSERSDVRPYREGYASFKGNTSPFPVSVQVCGSM